MDSGGCDLDLGGTAHYIPPSLVSEHQYNNPPLTVTRKEQTEGRGETPRNYSGSQERRGGAGQKKHRGIPSPALGELVNVEIQASQQSSGVAGHFMVRHRAAPSRAAEARGQVSRRVSAPPWPRTPVAGAHGPAGRADRGMPPGNFGRGRPLTPCRQPRQPPQDSATLGRRGPLPGDSRSWTSPPGRWAGRRF